jgi:hypothetical protein
VRDWAFVLAAAQQQTDGLAAAHASGSMQCR